MASTASNLRSDNRRQKILDSAAEILIRDGYRGASMRDIAKASGMLPGSIYYHFASKEALLVAVFEVGVQRIRECVNNALERAKADPWVQLRVACEVHLDMLLGGGSKFAQVVVRVLPSDVPGAEVSLVMLRDKYETRFRDLVDALPLKPETDRGIFRLMLLGAMNHTPVWFRSNGVTAKELAYQFIKNLQSAQSS